MDDLFVDIEWHDMGMFGGMAEEFAEEEIKRFKD
jgi:hypothetical protein